MHVSTRPLLVSIRITVTPDHPQFYHPPFRKDSNFLLPPRSFLSTSPLGSAPFHPALLPSSSPFHLLVVRFFSTVHGLNLCLIADYWDFARMRKKRGDRGSLGRLSSPGSACSWKLEDCRREDGSLILSIVSRFYRSDFIFWIDEFDRLFPDVGQVNARYIKLPARIDG